jgi:hypothetical protein
MGFMDKAKQLAEQAQQKLDEAQEGFNQSAAPQEGAPQQGAVQYDEHGRPVQPDPPAGATPAAPAAPTPDPAAAEASDVEEPDAPEVTEQPQPLSPTGGANANPDPFKPLQQ